MKFAHIVNFVAPEDNPSLEQVQAFSVRTMRAASAYSKENIEVEFLAAQFANARSIVPQDFRATADLVVCAAESAKLKTRKRLPLLREIISRLSESGDATHFIYTNADICLMPFFYEAVAAYIAQGHDAIVINRRRISEKFLAEKNLSLAYGESGKAHTGYDCFVFSRTLLSKMKWRDIFVGVPPSGNDLFYNLFTFAENPVLFTEKHLTFHAGMELFKDWGGPELDRHNQKEFLLLMDQLRPHIDISKFPAANENFFRRHFKWLMNFTFHYPTMLRADFKQFGRKRKPRAKAEVRGRKQRYLEWLITKVNFRDGE